VTGHFDPQVNVRTDLPRMVPAFLPLVSFKQGAGGEVRRKEL